MIEPGTDRGFGLEDPGVHPRLHSGLDDAA
jgi:hypothetical protein